MRIAVDSSRRSVMVSVLPSRSLIGVVYAGRRMSGVGRLLHVASIGSCRLEGYLWPNLAT